MDENSSTTTSAFDGKFLVDKDLRKEFLEVTKKNWKKSVFLKKTWFFNRIAIELSNILLNFHSFI